MIDLDDPGSVRAGDPADMLGAVAALPRHVAEAYANGRAASGLPDLASPPSCAAAWEARPSRATC